MPLLKNKPISIFAVTLQYYEASHPNVLEQALELLTNMQKKKIHQSQKDI